MNLVAATVGRLIPRYRTLREWLETYDRIIAARPIAEHTLSNRRGYMRRLGMYLGGRCMVRIRPHEVAEMVADTAREHPYTAKRLLTEARDVFDQAICYGWLDRNPAEAVRPPRVHVARHRLSLEDWRKIHAWSVDHSPPWVSRLLVLALVTGQRRSDLLNMVFDDVWSGHLHVVQQKTGSAVAIPLGFRMQAVGISVGEAIEACQGYADESPLLIRKANGGHLVGASASWRFEQAREGALGVYHGDGAPPSLHEIRSLTARLAEAEGYDVQTLMGHRSAAMTALYEDDRGLNRSQWKTLSLEK